MSIDLPEILVIHLENAMKVKKNEIPELKQAAFMPNIQQYYVHQRLIGQHVTHLDYRPRGSCRKSPQRLQALFEKSYDRGCRAVEAALARLHLTQLFLD